MVWSRGFGVSLFFTIALNLNYRLMSLNVFKPSPDIEPLRAQNSLLSESDYPLSLTQRAILERRILLEKELGPVQYQHSSLQEQLDQVIEILRNYILVCFQFPSSAVDRTVD